MPTPPHSAGDTKENPTGTLLPACHWKNQVATSVYPSASTTRHTHPSKNPSETSTGYTRTRKTTTWPPIQRTGKTTNAHSHQEA